MLSILISSRSPSFLNDLSININATIGIPYELLVAENKDGAKGICRVYNELAQQANFNYLLFLHEDVCFHSNDWGAILIKELNDKHTGLIGLIGGDTITKVPSGWSKQDKRFNFGRVLQSADERIKDLNTPGQKEFEPVLALDGVFLACRKSIWAEFPFNEALLPGFHGYDFEFSLNIAQRYTVKICNSILLEHFSKGNFSEDWLNVIVLLNKKWNAKLPMSLNSDLSQSEMSDIEYWQAVMMLEYASEKKMKKKIKLYIIRQFLNQSRRNIPQAFKLLKYVF